MVRLIWPLLFLALICVSNAAKEKETKEEEDPNDLSHGFNKDIDWVSFEDSFFKAEKEKKPIFLLIHKSWCGACKALKPLFARAKQILKMSKYFVMVNLADDDEPEGDMFTPDGNYIPRILFMEPDGSVMKEIMNENNKKENKYYYPDPGVILKSMKKVLKKLNIAVDKKDEL